VIWSLSVMAAVAAYQTQQAPSAGGDPWSKLYTYGPLGIFAGAFMWFAYQAYKKVVQDRDDERNYSRDLEKQLRENIMPLLAKVAEVTADAAKTITKATAEIAVRDEIRTTRTTTRRKTGG
jgi:hypothetical protein